MVRIEDVKQLSHEVVESHNNRGFSIVKLTDGERPEGVLLNVTLEPLVRKGRELRAKADVRRFLWECSQCTGGRRKDRSYVWTRYMDDQDVSVMGLATVVSKEVAERMIRKNEGFQWIEVSR
jgi:hypothetical protein